MVDSSTRQPALAVLRDYELLKRLGKGGMGAVYLARHRHLDRYAAIKLLPREHLRNPEMVERFKREMKAVARLHHPNIIQAHDGGEEKGVHYLVLEYAKGLDLATLIHRFGPLPIADACEIIRQAAVGLQHAHQHGLVHRDIKPSNLFISRPNAPVPPSPNEDAPAANDPSNSGERVQPTVKILDLGLALLHGEDQQALARGLTNTGRIMGTLDYMAPEQTTDTHAVDIRADIYSLGCTLYALLTGSAPFSGPQYSHAYHKLKAHNEDTPRPIHELRKNIPDGVVTILNKMLAKRPEDRYQTPIEAARALESFSAGHTLNSTLIEAESRQAEPKTRSDAATQDLNASALQGTTGAGVEAMGTDRDDELLALLRSTAQEETGGTQRAGSTHETAFHLQVESSPALKHLQRVHTKDQSRLRWHVLTAAACAIVGILLAAVVLRIMNNYGTIELTLYHKDAQVTIDGDTIRLRPGPDDDEYLIRVSPGNHKLAVTKNGFTTFSRDIEIAKGETKLVGVQLIPADHAASTLPKVASTVPRAEPSPPNPVPPSPPDTSSDSSPSGSSRRSVTATLEEPPPLEEWLQGREILTVKQDGTAMFTKIQDALDALKPGQVVEVLDKGPYVENLFTADLPADSALISRVSTTINAVAYAPRQGVQTGLVAHDLRTRDSFRLTGFYFRDGCAEEIADVASILILTCLEDAIVERCVFTTRNRSSTFYAVSFYTTGTTTLQDTFVFGRFGVFGGGPALVQRNLCRNQGAQAASFGGFATAGTRLFQWNIVDSPNSLGPMLGNAKGDSPRVFFRNNTIRTNGQAIDLTPSMLQTEFRAEQNIFSEGGVCRQGQARSFPNCGPIGRSNGIP